MKIQILYLLLTLSWLSRCTSKNSNLNMNSKQTLIQKLEIAIQNDIAVCNIDKAVDNSYLLNTCDEANRELWYTIEFDPDPDAKDLFLDLSDVKNAVYWKVNHPTLSKIIGIYWNKSDVPKLFRAIVLPP